MQEIETDKFKDLGELIAALNKMTAQAGGEKYTLTFDDVKQLHERYQQLETNIKNTEKRTGAAYLREIDNYLICALKHEARKISKVRDAEYEGDEAKLAAKKREETPATRRNPWKFFKKEKNRAQELVDEEAAINADYLHNVKEADLNRQEKELEQIEVGSAAGEYLSLRKRIKLRRKIAKHKRALRRLEKKWRADASEPEEDEGVQREAPAPTAHAASNTKPTKKPKKKVVKPVVIEEMPGQLPGQMRIDNADTTN